MGSIAVFVIGGAAMALAVWLIVHYRATERAAPLLLDRDAPRGERFGVVVGRASALMAAAVVSAVLVPGLGGRLLMRLLGATSPESAQGRLTDADEVVGEVTFDGTLFFVLFIGVFGGLLSLLVFIILRRWLPQRSLVAGLVIAGIGGGLFARPSGFIDPDNHDFVLLSPAWLAILSALLVVVAYGLLFAVLADRWATDWPVIDRSRRGVAAAVPFGLLFALSLAGGIPAVVIALVVAIGVFVRPRFDADRLGGIEAVGRGITTLGALAGAGWLLFSSVEVLRL